MKNVLVLIHDDRGQEARLQAALDATRALDGHLQCVHLTELVPVAGNAFDMSGATMIVALEQETESANRAKVEARLAREDVSWDLVEIAGSAEPAILDQADLADLIVANSEQPVAVQSDRGALVERLATRLRKPILAVNDASKRFCAADPALVAWDGSDPAAAALKAAMPLLKLSEAVTVYEVDEGGKAHDAEAAAEYLSRHGVHAEVVRDRTPDADFVEPLLLSKLESGSYGWAVMGAFSRSRFLEGLFGGTTKRLLKESPVPLLIAH